MRALVVDPSAPEAVRLTEIAEPLAAGDDVLVEVRHAALNYGDLNDARSGRVPPGAVLGSDLAGIVVRSGPSRPPRGTRVVALASGAFTEQVVVDPGSLAEVPAGVDLAQAAALPVAGVAALRARRCGRCA
jgi:NADPH:quinone reductase-like Zn-dependent oxidoreductase